MGAICYNWNKLKIQTILIILRLIKQLLNLKGNKMKNLIKTISVLIVTLSIGSSAFAYDFWTTPRLGGGWNYNEDISGWTTPRLRGL